MNARDNFYEGYNCAQSVAVAFADELGIPKEIVAKTVSGFGGGFSRLREVCGAISGMVFVADVLYGYSDPKNYQEKVEHYQRIRDLIEKFKLEAGAIRCVEILKKPEVGGAPEIRTPEYYKKRICPDLCALAEKILRKYIEDNPIKNKKHKYEKSKD